MENQNSGEAKRDINTVLEEHDDTLMAVPGVVGVFAAESREKIAQIHVMVEKRTPELEKKIPKYIEGYPVVIEETGEIKPLY